MRKLFLLLAVTGLLLGLVGPASAVVWDVDVFSVQLNQRGRVAAVDGAILCSPGQKFIVEARVTSTTRDADALGRATGWCGDSWTYWSTFRNMTFSDKFQCGDVVVVRGFGKTTGDGHTLSFRERVRVSCGGTNGLE